MKKLLFLLLLFINITTAFQILPNSSNKLQPDNYKIHCCYSNICLLSLENDNQKIPIRLQKNDCLVLSNEDLSIYNKLIFTSIKRSYIVDLTKNDCSIKENIDKDNYNYIVKVQCKKPHFITITEKLQFVTITNESKPKTALVKLIPLSENQQYYYVYIDNYLKKTIVIPARLKLFISVSKTKNGFKIKLKSNKNAKCEFEVPPNYVIYPTSLNLIANNYYEIIAEAKKNTEDTIQKFQQFEFIAKCSDNQNLDYTFTKTYYQPYKKTASKKLIEFLTNYWLFIVLIVVIWFVSGYYVTYKRLNESAKEKLEKN